MAVVEGLTLKGVVRVGTALGSIFNRGGAGLSRRLSTLPSDELAAEVRDAERAAIRPFGRVNQLAAGKAQIGARILRERGIELVLNPLVQSAFRFSLPALILRGRQRTRTRPDRPIPPPPRQNLPGENLPVPAPRQPPQGPPKPPPRKPPPGGVPEPPGGIPPWVGKVIGADAALRIARDVFEGIRKLLEDREDPPVLGDRDMTPAERRAERAGEPPIVRPSPDRPIVLPDVDIRVPAATIPVPSPPTLIGGILRSPITRAVLPAVMSAAGVRLLSRAPAQTQTVNLTGLGSGFLPGSSASFDSFAAAAQPLLALAGSGGGLTPVEARVQECIARCQQPRRRRRRRARTVCYEGTYRETSRGQRKLRRREVPCE